MAVSLYYLFQHTHLDIVKITKNITTEHEDVNYKRSLVHEPRGAPAPDEEDLRRSRMPPKKKLFAKSGTLLCFVFLGRRDKSVLNVVLCLGDKERITEKERFVGDSPLGEARLPDGL
jgi:hypothetical protein